MGQVVEEPESVGPSPQFMALPEDIRNELLSAIGEPTVYKLTEKQLEVASASHVCIKDVKNEQLTQ